MFYYCKIDELEDNIYRLAERQVDSDGAKTIKRNIDELQRKIEELRFEIKRILDPEAEYKEAQNSNDKLRNVFSKLAEVVGTKKSDKKDSVKPARKQKPPASRSRAKKIG